MRSRRVTGYTLIEMLIVVSLLTLVAAIAVPAFDDNDEASLDRATSEVARAMRFAHAEAVRTGQPYGVVGNQAAQSLKVYRLDDTVNPPVVQYDVYDPQTKQLYDLRFGAGQLDAAITQIYFKFKGYFSPQTFLGFAGSSGTPKYAGFGTVYMLETGYIRLGLDGMTRTVSIAPMTGRVTVQ